MPSLPHEGCTHKQNGGPLFSAPGLGERFVPSYPGLTGWVGSSMSPPAPGTGSHVLLLPYRCNQWLLSGLKNWPRKPQLHPEL